MLILDRYVTQNFIKTFLSCVFAFLFLYIIIDIFSNLGDMLKNHPPPLKIVEYYLYATPLMFTQTSPIASLLATLFTVGALNQSNEIIAMRACGRSIFSIVKPFIFFGLILSLGIFLLSETILPKTIKMGKIIKDCYIDRSASGGDNKAIEKVAVYGFNNRLFFINKLYPKTNTIEGLTILEHDDKQNIKTKIYAEKAVWRNNRWVFYQCFIYHLNENQRVKGEPLYFGDTFFQIEETPQDLMRQNIPVENMNIKELSSYIGKLSQSNATAAINKIMVDLYQKTSFPFTSLIIILIGIPSSIVIRRRAVAFSSIGLCIGIGFIFYVAFAVSIALGKTGALPPFAAAWISHVIFGGLALYFIAKIP